MVEKRIKEVLHLRIVSSFHLRLSGEVGCGGKEGSSIEYLEKQYRTSERSVGLSFK